MAKVKVKNYKAEEAHVNFKENSIVFPTINKEKYTNIVIKLNEEDSDLLNIMKFEGNYLLTIGGKEENRCNNYSTLITTLSDRYFGQKLNQTDLRHLATTASYKKTEHLPEKEKALLREKESRSRGHSSKTASQYYVEDTNDVRVCLKNKSELTIVNDSGDIEYSYNLKELIVVMEYHKYLKERI